MSNVFISTANCGKAHDADIFGLSVCNPYTVTCSGDGSIKLWKNNLLDNELPRNNYIRQFVHKTGVHHVEVFHSVERGGNELCIIACVSFSGHIFFYNVDIESGDLNELNLLSPKEDKKSYWAIKWYKSDDSNICHRFAATDVKGSTYVWRFHPFEEELDEEQAQKEKMKREAKARRNGEYVPDKDAEIDSTFRSATVRPHLMLDAEIPAQKPAFATCIDISSSGLIATGFSNGNVVISQLRTLRPIHNFEAFGIQGIEQNSNTVRDVKFSPLGTILAVASDSGSYGCVTMYETEYGERIGSLTVPTHSNQATIGAFAHSGWVFGLSFNSTGEFLASCGYDSKVRVWDVKSRERVSTLNITASDIEEEQEILLEDEHGDSLKFPPVMAVKFINKGVRKGMGSDTNEGLCCVCMDRSVRWFREAGGA
ncbi:hypothetical protein HG535_0B02560 [Zygotorulaspora mrakii]|uniref:Uncharacterized protein n=1 Tax=Zygotorulaspora mrakii TaxID=42260 RepID=A0A7H9AYH9_ZYGMR|nr:uncharacterized protein HG535_0B02560 [Zygotorulaspora mrakii]QLG71217.1 hypothetical protein HG535_0B02560 [Zygotorulaspora mrakii]